MCKFPNSHNEVTEILASLSLNTKPIILYDPLTLGKQVFHQNYEVLKKKKSDLPNLVIKIYGDPTIPEFLSTGQPIFINKCKGQLDPAILQFFSKYKERDMSHIVFASQLENPVFSRELYEMATILRVNSEID